MTGLLVSLREPIHKLSSGPGNDQTPTHDTKHDPISHFPFFFFGLLFFGFRDRILLYNLDWLGTQDQAILLPQAPQVLGLQVHATKPIFLFHFLHTLAFILCLIQ